MVKASDEFVRNLFIHDQIKSSMYVATFWVSEKITYTFILIHVVEIVL